MNVNDDPLNGQDIGLEFMRKIEKSMSSEVITLHNSSKFFRSMVHHVAGKNIFSFNDPLLLYILQALHKLKKKTVNKDPMLIKRLVFQKPAILRFVFNHNKKDERTFTILNDVLMSSIDNHTLITVIRNIAAKKIPVINHKQIIDKKNRNVINLISFSDVEINRILTKRHICHQSFRRRLYLRERLYL